MILIVLMSIGIADAAELPEQDFELNIVHVNDTHSNILPPETLELRINGQKIYAPLGGYGQLVTLFKSLDGSKNLLKLHSGDAITGTYFYNLYEGETDAIAMNTVCFDAFSPGNHEFDFGDIKLKKFLDLLAAQPLKCNTPVLAANIHPGTDPSPASPLISRPDGSPYFLPYIIKVMSGVKVGILGIDVVGKTKNASKPDAATVFEDEVVAAQRTIDKLKALGAKHIVLMSHIGYDTDLALAPQLTDVDVIIGGDSHTLLGNYSPVVNKTMVGKYPTVVTNKNGEMVCIGHAWEYTKIFARMNVKFNKNGTVKSCDGTSSVIVGNTLYYDSELTRPLGANENNQMLKTLATIPDVAVASEDIALKAALSTYLQKYDEDTRAQIGTLQGDQPLCLIRIPGTKNRGGPICDQVQTQAGGSDITQVIGEAYRKATESASDPFVADFAIINAGSARKELETNGSTDRSLEMGDVLTLQPFPNELFTLDISGADVKTALEQGVQNWLDHGNSDGSHPYASGLRWDLDLSKPFGARFYNLMIKNHQTGDWSSLSDNKIYRAVITSYMKSGAENYKIFKDLCLSAEINKCLPIGGVYTSESLANYIKSTSPKKLTRQPCSEYSHQRVIKRDGTSLLRCQ